MDWWIVHWVCWNTISNSHRDFFLLFSLFKIEVWLLSCFSLVWLFDCSPPGSSVHGILQARILEWIAISFSRGFSQLRDQTLVSHTASRLLIICATREAHKLTLGQVQLANWNDLWSPHPIPALKKSPTLGILMPFICIPMADSCWCIRNQHNIVKKLSSN